MKTPKPIEYPYMVVHPLLELRSYGETEARRFKTLQEARRYIHKHGWAPEDVRLYKELSNTIKPTL